MLQSIEIKGPFGWDETWRIENKGVKTNFMCLVRENERIENWRGTGVFSPTPPKFALSNLGRK